MIITSTRSVDNALLELLVVKVQNVYHAVLAPFMMLAVIYAIIVTLPKYVLLAHDTDSQEMSMKKSSKRQESITCLMYLAQMLKQLIELQL